MCFCTSCNGTYGTAKVGGKTVCDKCRGAVESVKVVDEPEAESSLMDIPIVNDPIDEYENVTDPDEVAGLEEEFGEPEAEEDE